MAGRTRSAPRAPVSAAVHNRVVAAAAKRAESLEDRLTELLEPLFVAAGHDAARAFREKARDHLSASAILLAAGPLRGVTSSSAMVCVKPRPDEAEAIADPNGSPAESLHVTLVSLGELAEDELPALREALAPVAGEHAPLEGVVGGYGEFRPPGCGILLPDVPGLVELRVAVTEALVDGGLDYARNHGFQPHMTVDGSPEDGEIDEMLERVAGAPLHFDAILVVRGDEVVVELPLVGVRPLTAAGDDIAKARAERRLNKAQRDLRDALESGNVNRIDDAKAELRAAKSSLGEIVSGSTWTKPAGDELIDARALAQTLRTKTDPVRQRLVETTMTPSLREAGLSFDVSNPLTAKALATTGEHITSISETTRANVMRIVSAAHDAGLSIPDTAKAIMVGMREAAPIRARMIARTELVGAINGGSLAATSLVGSVTGDSYNKTWRTAPGAPNPRHEEYDGLDGQSVPLDQPFDVGGVPLMYPGDPDGDAGEVINCFPGETLVEMPGLRAATRRWYDGDLVRVRLASGDTLAGTPNHPVLRADGRWVPLREVEQGDNLVGARLAWDDAGAPDPERPPAAISEVYRLTEMVGEPERVRLSPPDLHGDGSDGEVEVVALDGKLLLDVEAASDEEVVELGLALASGARARTSRGDGALAVFDGWGEHLAWSAAYGVSPASQEATILVVHPLHPQSVRGRPAPRWEAEFAEATQNGRATYAEVLADGEDAVAALVTLTEVVEVDIEPFHGYVYNLDAGRGWYTAGTVACRNCRCTMTYETPEGEQETDADSGFDLA